MEEQQGGLTKASSVLYTVAKVFNIIEIVCVVLVSIISLAGIAMKDDVWARLDAETQSQLVNIDGMVAMLSGLLIACIIGLVIQIVILVFGKKGKAALGTTNTTPHVVVLVFAVLGGGIFYLLASIFGLVVSSRGAAVPVRIVNDENKQDTTQEQQ